jgi:hypothetical protein
MVLFEKITGVLTWQKAEKISVWPVTGSGSATDNESAGFL